MGNIFFDTIYYLIEIQLMNRTTGFVSQIILEVEAMRPEKLRLCALDNTSKPHPLCLWLKEQWL